VNAPVVAHTRAELQAGLRTVRRPGRHAVVLTMGALHDGHVALIRAARSQVGHEGSLAVTIFVNPLQFGADEDLARYPRSLESDLSICAREGVDLVFAPSEEELYPHGEPAVRVDPGVLGTVLEGAARPGHFAGVLTVVLKLLHLTEADVTFFGEKDYQQLVLVRRMIDDLDMDVLVLGVPIVRAADGLALSSRNARLTAVERNRATAMPRALDAASAESRRSGDVEAIRSRAIEVMAAEPLMKIDYVEVVDPDLGPVSGPGPARILLAVRVGGTRLLDNAPVVLGHTAW